MWPSTPAGRQHLAERCRTCCLRANENPRPLRCLIFRGSIPHPMQSLCTLRDHCRQWPRNTRYQADATPYLGRTSTGWIAPACGWRTPPLHPTVGGGEQPGGNLEFEASCRLDIDDELELGRPVDRQVRRLRAFEDATGIESGAAIRVSGVVPIADHAASHRE